MRVGNYYYIFPNGTQAKKAIWNAITNDGKRFLDYIPKELVASTNGVEMLIRLVNGSTIQLIGAKTYDSVMGTNPQGIIFSEYAKCDPMSLQYILPILRGNNGFLILQSTPRGKNDFYRMLQIAKDNPDTWYYEIKTIRDLKHISEADVQHDIDTGLMSYDLAQQEYYCDFSLGVSGSFYSSYLDQMHQQERITQVPWDPSFKVHTAWDLGMRDYTSIIFFQTIGQTIRVLETYKNADKGLEFYAKYLQTKPYTYGKHIAPHDIKVRELGTGVSRLEKMRQLGVSFIVAPNLSIEDGIEATRTLLPRMWINESTNKDLIESLEHYRKEFDESKQIYKDRALHDKYSHVADALRYLAITHRRTTDSMTSEDIDKIKQEALYGNQQQFAPVFQDHNRY